MTCKDCGAIGFTSSSCPDCGSDNVVEELGGGTSTTAMANRGSAATAAKPSTAAAMPEVELTVAVTKPVTGTVKLPDDRLVELRDGEEFLVADEGTDQEVHFKVSGDPTVSGTPVKVAAVNGKGHVTGGGSNGFALDITLRFKPDEVVEVPKSPEEVADLIKRGRFSAVALKMGKATRFPLKF